MARCKTCKTKVEECKDYGTWPAQAIRVPAGVFCGQDCFQKGINKALDKAAKKRKKSSADTAKAERKQLKAQKAVLNQTVTHWRPLAQRAFNTFVRNRDRLEPCISCGSTREEISKNYSGTGGLFHGGHYLSTGASPELRFSEDNCHKQCAKCNKWLSGNVVKYRTRLIDKIGVHRVDVLEGPHELPHWKWFHYEAVYNWYHTLNKRFEHENRES